MLCRQGLVRFIAAKAIPEIRGVTGAQGGQRAMEAPSCAGTQPLLGFCGAEEFVPFQFAIEEADRGDPLCCQDPAIE